MHRCRPAQFHRHSVLFLIARRKSLAAPRAMVWRSVVVLASAQALLGIGTLLLRKPFSWRSLHQMGALLLLGSFVIGQEALRQESCKIGGLLKVMPRFCRFPVKGRLVMLCDLWHTLRQESVSTHDERFLRCFRFLFYWFLALLHRCRQWRKPWSTGSKRQDKKITKSLRNF